MSQRRSSSTRARRLAALTGVGVLVAGLSAGLTTGPATGSPGGSARGPATAAAGSGDHPGAAVTLVTGDRVLVRDETGGHRSVQLEPADGRDHVDFHQLEIDGELHVLPADAVPLVAAGRLDDDLFNIDLLLADGYDDEATETLPLIATTSGSLRSLSTLAGADQGATLPSVGGRAMEVRKDEAADFWASLSRPGTERMAAGVRKLWLDGRVRADLDRSVAQIGAPTAWEAGFDGDGVTVAVLDTGVDSAHPDLAGRVSESRNFSDSSDAADHFGHGTHVAATIGGSGNGSDGLRKGVAPGSDILSGKVLDDTGNGYESDIIEAMEWAVAADADVVNMSLGGGPTDGTDPLSQAVNELSATSDSLFVVSAGNDGPGASTIGTPGSADASLTVGAVDRDESLADFSSRGPRLGDLAIKPDLTAPGVDIVAARASGTTMGTPVDALYTSASGTSMAAPHVSGAAVLLAQQHPDWTGEQLKDALISTALPGDLTEHEQGGGRVDVARAVTQPVHGTGTVNLGDVVDGETDPVTSQITWTNTGEAEVTLDLELDVTELGGAAPAAGALTLDADTVVVPAGSTASVTLTLDPTKLEHGRYAGQLLATADGVVTHTTIGAVKAAPTHKVTFRAVDFNGESITATPVVLTGEDPRFDTLVHVWKGETETVEVGEGDYFLSAMVTPDVDDENSGVAIIDPDLEVTRDMDVVLDAGKATRVQVRTPRPTTPRGNLGYTTYRKIAGRTITHSVQKFDDTRSIWVTPTEAAKGGEFEFTSRWQLAEPMVTATTSGRRPLELLPALERYSPTVPGTRRLEVVEAGAGKAADYAGLDAKGTIALVHPASKGGQDVKAAVDAGVAMLLIAPPEGTQWWTKFTGRGTRSALPVLVLSPKERDLLTARMAQGRVDLRISGIEDSRYTYDVVQVSQGRVPEQVVHEVTRRNSATVTARYHEMGGEPWAKEQRFAWRPWQDHTIVESQRELHTPQQRTETISSGAADTLWRQHVLHLYSWDTMNPITTGAVHGIRTYRPGEKVTYDWFGPVVRPAVPAGTVPTRTNDTLKLNVAELAGDGGSTYDRASAAETTMRLFENGELIVSGDRAWGTYPAGSPEADYRLDLEVERSKDANWEFSTHTETSWRFHSGRPRTGTADLPLLQVDYDVPAGLDHAVRPGSIRPLGFKVGLLGSAHGAPVTNVRAWVSFDDGDSWQRLALVRWGRSGWRTLLRHPRDAGHVSLRVHAEDREGNSIDQTVVRAYGIS
ncbi:S8 family peptidase [Nocardioides jensenii]|uniref:S8 family peptidase n=1 Tax=Nocardioides jensenii TaxID=1843 RepID=UPI000833921F|nr:S8 family serine peptidase [Nocardioides jensenii]